MADRIELYIPTSRFVSGSFTELRTTNGQGQPIPEDKQQYEFGLALQKNDPRCQEFFGNLMQAATNAMAGNAQAQQMAQNWFQTMSGFSMKVSDGDKPNLRGQINPNTQGCYVIWMSTSFPVTCSDNANTAIDPHAIKRGYYVDCLASVANNNQQLNQIGIYMNPNLLRFQGVGEEIVGGPSIEDMASRMPANAGALPPGALPPGSAPIASNPMPQQQPAAPAAPAVPAPAAPAPNPMAAPAPTMAPAAPAPAAPPGLPVGGQQPAPAQPNGAIGYPTNVAPQHPPHTGIMPAGTVPGLPQG